MPAHITLSIQADPCKPRIAGLLLNNPEKPNAINDGRPHEIRAAVEWANAKPSVHVIVVEGEGK
jgi:enoyl-CoA hydratase